MLLSQFPLTHIRFTTDAPFHRIAYDFSHADWDRLLDYLRDVPWEDIFKLGASAAASEFCELVQVGIDLCIPHRKYQTKRHSSPWFSSFFICTNKINLLNPKEKFRQASNHCKKVLEAAKLA